MAVPDAISHKSSHECTIEMVSFVCFCECHSIQVDIATMLLFQVQRRSPLLLSCLACFLKYILGDVLEMYWRCTGDVLEMYFLTS